MFGKRNKVKHLLHLFLTRKFLSKKTAIRFISQVMLRVIVHLWVKHDVRSISCFFCKKKLMAVLLRFCRTNLNAKIFYFVWHGTLWYGNPPLVLHRTTMQKISERLKAVRMNIRLFNCWISNESSVARMHANKISVPWLNSTHSQLSLEKKLRFRKHL